MQTVANRIQDAIDNLYNRTVALESAKLDALNKSLDIDHADYCAYQDAKSQAQAAGKLSFDEAVTIYAILGSGPEAFNGSNVAEKCIVTQIIGELLAARLGKVTS